MNNKQWQIGSVKIDGQAILAPMAGVSDIAYRLLAKEQGAALVCTEMVSAMGIKYKNERTHELLRIEDAERPVSMQILVLIQKQSLWGLRLWPMQAPIL